MPAHTSPPFITSSRHLQHTCLPFPTLSLTSPSTLPCLHKLSINLLHSLCHLVCMTNLLNVPVIWLQESGFLQHIFPYMSLSPQLQKYFYIWVTFSYFSCIWRPTFYALIFCFCPCSCFLSHKNIFPCLVTSPECHVSTFFLCGDRDCLCTDFPLPAPVSGS